MCFENANTLVIPESDSVRFCNVVLVTAWEQFCRHRNSSKHIVSTLMQNKGFQTLCHSMKGAIVKLLTFLRILGSCCLKSKFFVHSCANGGFQSVVAWPNRVATSFKQCQEEVEIMSKRGCEGLH